jgi:hypothetical protein
MVREKCAYTSKLKFEKGYRKVKVQLIVEIKQVF